MSRLNIQKFQPNLRRYQISRPLNLVRAVEQAKQLTATDGGQTLTDQPSKKIKFEQSECSVHSLLLELESLVEHAEHNQKDLCRVVDVYRKILKFQNDQSN